MSNIEYLTSNDQCERIDETKDGGDQVIRESGYRENREHQTSDIEHSTSNEGG